MKIIAGLGNIGDKYKNTYHNAGFMVVENLAEQLGFSFSEKSQLKCKISIGNYQGEKVIIIMPTTFMNLSGESVQAVMSYYKAELKDLLVVYDDLDIPFGTLRFRESGSAGTHNGMRNIVALLSSTSFARLRIGTKPDNTNIPIIDYVLSNISSERKTILNETILKASNVCKDFINGMSAEMLMCAYNGKNEK